MKPARSRSYLAWIRTLPCVVCQTTHGVEAAHTGPHGLGQRSPDLTAIPLCGPHHRTGQDSYHSLGPRPFEAMHQIQVSKVVADLNLQWNNRPSINERLIGAHAGTESRTSPHGEYQHAWRKPQTPISRVMSKALSHSQIKTFMDCPSRWWFKYCLGVPEPATGNIAVGSTVHEALAANFDQKRETKKDLPVTAIIALCRDAWKRAAEEAAFRDDEDPDELGKLTELLSVKYLEEAAPGIEPAAVEVRVEGEISGVRVRGMIDVIDVYGCVIDIKTAARRPSGIDQLHRMQVSTYRKLLPEIKGEARIDTLVKTKTPQLVKQTFDVRDSDLGLG